MNTRRNRLRKIDSAVGFRIIPYYSIVSCTTCYIVARRDRPEAILVDPVHLDGELYAIILRKELDIRWVLITHPEAYMRHPLNTLGRIFDFQLVAGESELFGNPCNRLNPEDTNEIILDGITVQAIPFLPHSRSSYVFLIGNVLFPGAILHAGTLGDTPSEYNEELLVATVKDYLFSIPHAERDVLLMPSVGPPSTIRAERHLSPYYRDRDSGV